MKSQSIYFANPTVLIAAGFALKLSSTIKRSLLDSLRILKTLTNTPQAYASRVAWL